ncbi:hypothetical protein C1701_00305 [Actinoalloteichus sp. AHMU CJ021]|uniref:hypothetical protein n=1 Tax=Actinoalloteichus TaxID=65496 RepID=UPI0004AAFAD1|nr:hypothetical protein [Actinoalloteichus caeruleus]AUS77052.1 hypothetical protein C1701_00305 [Actinoalloteichus sp. AHMU CJ021]
MTGHHHPLRTSVERGHADTTTGDGFHELSLLSTTRIGARAGKQLNQGRGPRRPVSGPRGSTPATTAHPSQPDVEDR